MCACDWRIEHFPNIPLWNLEFIHTNDAQTSFRGLLQGQSNIKNTNHWSHQEINTKTSSSDRRRRKRCRNDIGGSCWNRNRREGRQASFISKRLLDQWVSISSKTGPLARQIKLSADMQVSSFCVSPRNDFSHQPDGLYFSVLLRSNNCLMWTVGARLFHYLYIAACIFSHMRSRYTLEDCSEVPWTL